MPLTEVAVSIYSGSGKWSEGIAAISHKPDYPSTTFQYNLNTEIKSAKIS
jgi:hypothetical protein